MLKFWPDIDKQVLRQFADTVPREWPEKGLWVWKTQQTGEPSLHKRKKKGAVPHDLGVPEGDPFIEFQKAQQTYVSKLWNGEYFRYDTESENRDAIQADQLAGQWYANMLGLGDLVPHPMQVSAAKKIFSFNVMKFAGGQMGAANGMAADGSVINNEQAREVWTGTTFGFAALLLSEGMNDEGYKAAWGIYHVIYESKGYWFRTPEAWDITGNFRASMYMRPAGVWAMEMAQPPPAK